MKMGSVNILLVFVGMQFVYCSTSVMPGSQYQAGSMSIMTYMLRTDIRLGPF